ncbi:MAG: class I SAM-dependent methyltransferase [Alphaproteobacteria bacterium]|nr:MAG: class I SAM-dependent methyltransferase [Alphaproteobacteria bacterium]
MLDLGAGDTRFAAGGHFTRYDGVEIDANASIGVRLPNTVRVFTTCAFAFEAKGYDACIGNPPYVRHHDVEPRWRLRVNSQIEHELGIKLQGIGNLYLYFLCLALMKTRADGLVALILPFEWVSRPSAAPIRDYIDQQRWSVSVFRFQDMIFDGVLTTASVNIIDKTATPTGWKFFDVSPDLEVMPRRGVSGSRFSILPYSPRAKLWARRGISPGGQKIFALTDAERQRAGLAQCDVLPCVTSLKNLPSSLARLDKQSFQKNFVAAGKRCWLVKSTGDNISQRVKAYLAKIPKSERQTYACRHQDPWYKYETPPIPHILFHSGFMKRSPKVLVNSIGAQAVGAVYGVHGMKPQRLQDLRTYLAEFDFESRVVAHAKTLRKVEVAQLNTVLSRWQKAEARHG